MAKQPSEYELILEITDDAWNSVTKSWTIRVTDMTGPGIIPEILSNETPISPSSPARAGDSIVLSLTQSYDDLDAIEDTTWEISIDGEVIVAQADWSQAEQTTLPISEAGTYVIQVVAWDSAGNKEELSWGLVVSPTLGVYISVLDVTVIGDLVEGEIVNVVVTFENTGAATGTAQLCSGDSCSDDHIVRAAESSGPGVFDIEMYLELGSSDFDLRLDWTSESSSSNGSMEIEHDFVIQPSWQMPLQVVMAVLVLLMLLAWLAHRAWGPESLRP